MSRSSDPDPQMICSDAAGRFNLPEQLIEKDYYVTEAMRMAASTLEGDIHSIAWQSSVDSGG